MLLLNFSSGSFKFHDGHCILWLIIAYLSYLLPSIYLNTFCYTHMVFKLCLVSWLLSVAGCWVRTSAFEITSLQPAQFSQSRTGLLNWTWLGHWTWAQPSIVPPESVAHCQRGLSGQEAARWGDWWEEEGAKLVAELLPSTSSLWGTPRRESLSLEGVPGGCWPWLGPWCTPHLVAPSPSPVSVPRALSIQLWPWHRFLTMNFLSVASSLWNIPSSSAARFLVPFALGFLIETPIVSCAHPLLFPTKQSGIGQRGRCDWLPEATRLLQ